METVKFNNSHIPERYTELLNSINYSFSANFTDKIAYLLFAGATKCLRDIKSQERPAIVLFENLNGEGIFGVRCEYSEESEEGAVGGSWDITVTFDANDWSVEKVANNEVLVVRVSDSRAAEFFYNLAQTKYGMRFKTTEYMIRMLIELASMLKQSLIDNESNAKENEPYCISIENIADLLVSIEGGKPIIAIELSADIKRLAKGDDEQ